MEGLAPWIPALAERWVDPVEREVDRRVRPARGARAGGARRESAPPGDRPSSVRDESPTSPEGSRRRAPHRGDDSARRRVRPRLGGRRGGGRRARPPARQRDVHGCPRAHATPTSARTPRCSPTPSWPLSRNSSSANSASARERGPGAGPGDQRPALDGPAGDAARRQRDRDRRASSPTSAATPTASTPTWRSTACSSASTTPRSPRSAPCSPPPPTVPWPRSRRTDWPSPTWPPSWPPEDPRRRPRARRHDVRPAGRDRRDHGRPRTPGRRGPAPPGLRRRARRRRAQRPHHCRRPCSWASTPAPCPTGCAPMPRHGAGSTSWRPSPSRRGSPPASVVASLDAARRRGALAAPAHGRPRRHRDGPRWPAPWSGGSGTTPAGPACWWRSPSWPPVSSTSCCGGPSAGSSRRPLERRPAPVRGRGACRPGSARCSPTCGEAVAADVARHGPAIRRRAPRHRRRPRRRHRRRAAAARRATVGRRGGGRRGGGGRRRRRHVGAVDTGTAAPRACNGHVELCDRPYDEVVYAATHNSMSSPDVVPVWPEHDGDLEAQLDAGVRALLIDTHYWPPVTRPRP